MRHYTRSSGVKLCGEDDVFYFYKKNAICLTLESAAFSKRKHEK